MTTFLNFIFFKISREIDGKNYILFGVIFETQGKFPLSFFMNLDIKALGNILFLCTNYRLCYIAYAIMSFSEVKSVESCNIFKEIRTSLGLSQTAFAKRLHVSFSTINRWENNRAQPNRLAIVTLIDFAKQNNINSNLLSALEDRLNNKVNGE